MSLLQLSSLGSQDSLILSSSGLTFFKVLYRRHTNFVIEAQENQFQNTADFGNKSIMTINRSGDGIFYAYLSVTLPALTTSNLTGSPTWVGWTNTVGYAMIREVSFLIGGNAIVRHTGEWLDLESELCTPVGKQFAHNKCVGKSVGVADPGRFNAATAQTLYIPLRFFWNKGPGMMLPLIALQHHEVRLEFQFRTATECLKSDVAGTATNVSFSNPVVWFDYVMLDRGERFRFAQYAHEYLIEQVQFVGEEPIPANASFHKARLNFNHPTKALYWVFRNATNSTMNTLTGNNWFSYEGLAASPNRHPFQTMKIQLNANDRIRERTGDFFQYVQQYQHQTNTTPRNIYMYSFALFPEEHQPSGSCNFSRIDTANMNFTMEAGANPAYSLLVFALSVNVLRIMAGMGGLGFAA